MSKNTHTTREGWLQAATKALDAKFFSGKGYKLPEKLGCSCGFPRGHARAIGQCWHPSVAKDGTTHIFICPSQDDTMRVLDILLHELIHAAVGLACGHRGAFKKLATEFGLTGKMTATVCEPGSELHRQLASIATELGDYPHSAMGKRNTKGDGDEGEGEGKGGARPWSMWISVNNPEFKVYAHAGQVAEFGEPRDPDGGRMYMKGTEPPTEEGEDE